MNIFNLKEENISEEELYDKLKDYNGLKLIKDYYKKLKLPENCIYL